MASMDEQTVKLWRLSVAGIWECEELPPAEAILELYHPRNVAPLYLAAKIVWGNVNSRAYDTGGYLTHPVPMWPHN